MSEVIVTTYEELAKKFVQDMLDLQNKTTANIIVGLSGGSTLPPLLQAISQTIGANKLSRVVFTFIDERLVPYNSEGSNYGAMKTAIELCGLKAIPLPCEDCKVQAFDYQRAIAKDKLPEIDLLLLGYGDDGHIASLFPGSAVLNRRCVVEEWIFRATASYEPKERWSWGMEALTNSKKTYCLFKGAAESVKAQRLNAALFDENCDTPLARFIKMAKNKTSFFRVL
jgi:6-phosphogluconolactonase